MSEPAKRIPINIITGLLGVGKTTAIARLLEQVPAGQRWAVLVNEFGTVGLDAAMLGKRPLVRELAGGCLCCTLGVPLQTTLAQMIREVRPDRILIEPTGLGHPAALLDSLRTGALGEQLDVRATLTLVDPRQAEDPRVQAAAVYQDQVHLADVLLAAKCDLTPPDVLDRFLTEARGMFPPKIFVGVLDAPGIKPAWLDLPTDPGRVPLFPQAHHYEEADHAGHAHHHHDEEPVLETPRPGHPLRYVDDGLGQRAYGWVFAAEDRFLRSRLRAFVNELTATELAEESPRLLRAKGVFHVGGQWLLLNWLLGQLPALRPIAYRRDSRLELIASAENAPDWDAIHERLLGCLATQYEAEAAPGQISDL